MALVRGWARPELLLFASLAPLLAVGILTPQEAFAGFSNSAPLAVGALFVVAAGVQATGALAFTDRLLFRTGGSVGAVTARLMLTAAVLSAFLNNTPLVAMLMPRVQAWCERAGVSPSKLMIPLSYAAIVGGMTTLIGTSTNLLVAGLMDDAGVPGFGMFDLTLVGAPAAIAVIAYFVVVGHRTLPDRGTPASAAPRRLAAPTACSRCASRRPRLWSASPSKPPASAPWRRLPGPRPQPRRDRPGVARHRAPRPRRAPSPAPSTRDRLVPRSTWSRR